MNMNESEKIIFEELEEVVMSYVANCHHAAAYYELISLEEQYSCKLECCFLEWKGGLKCI